MTRIRPAVPTVVTQRVLCPYCGEVSTDPRRCDACRGFFDPLSRQATQNAMGPWFIRDESAPWRPGCSIETLRDLIRRGKITRDTVIRGPGTKQFWNFAGRTPSIANLLGVCHNCRAAVKSDDYSCKACGAVFTPDADRQHLGLAPAHILPGEASPEIVAAASMDTPAPVPVSSMPVQPVATPVVVSRPVTIVSEPKAPKPASKVVEKESRAGMWVAIIAAVVLAGMGIVIALVTMGKLTIPGLTDTFTASPPSKALTTPPAAPVEPQTKSEPAVPKEAPKPAEPESAATSAEPPAAVPETVPAPKPSTNLESTLLPMLTKVPFEEAAMLAKIEELRKENPSLSKELDTWVAAAKARSEQLRLKKIP